ncbi:transposase [Lentzea pudingi]|uniref:transposase n=1 Tax=Lentzea pudingi TaxID=1789439 RepID=UPI0027E48FF2|nr:transposase [Lentzea pudingi]
MAQPRRTVLRRDHPPADGQAICVDELGHSTSYPAEENLATAESAATAAGHLQPQRRRDAHARRTRPRHISYRIRSRKRRQEFLAFLKTLRICSPGEKLYVVCDNLSPHRHADVGTWCAANQVELVFVPTCSSWSN